MRQAVLLVLFVAPLLLVPAGTAQPSGPEVVQVDVTGTITRGTMLHIEAALQYAEARNAPLLLRIDTPGGLVDATLEIDRVLANADVPVLAYVGPSGSFAASAGAFLLLMGQPSGMASGTSVGSAQPIMVGPGGGAQPAGDKVENFLIGRIRDIAERTGRDPDVAEQFVSENRNLNAQEARDLGMVDVVAGDVRSFLIEVHGMDARTRTSTVTLDTEDARVVVFERTMLARVVDILGNPQIAFIFVLAGTYALIFGLANPGSYVPEVIGALLLLLGFIGLGLFSVTTAGVLLLLLALFFFVIEVFTPTNGILTGVGVVALLFSALFLLRGEPLLGPSFLRTFYFAGLALALTSGAITFGAVTYAMRVRKRVSYDSLRDARAVVLDALSPEGTVTVFGEVWQAVSAGGDIAVGERVRIVRRDGLTLVVEPAAKRDAASHTEEE